MFKIGESYTIRQDINGIKKISCKVLEYDDGNGLLKINHSGVEKIINTTSHNFIDAELDKTRKHVKIDCEFKQEKNEEDEDPLVFY